MAVTVAVLTVSDRCYRGERRDGAGPALVAMAKRALGAEVVATACVPDEVEAIRAQLGAWTRESPQPDLILTTGGTGLAPRDVTPEATRGLLERRHAALLELARLRCSTNAPHVFLSRGEAGTIGRSLVINLPGSPRGASECLEALLDVLPHAIQTLRGETCHEANAAARRGTAPPRRP